MAVSVGDNTPPSANHAQITKIIIGKTTTGHVSINFKLKPPLRKLEERYFYTYLNTWVLPRGHASTSNRRL